MYVGMSYDARRKTWPEPTPEKAVRTFRDLYEGDPDEVWFALTMPDGGFEPVQTVEFDL